MRHTQLCPRYFWRTVLDNLKIDITHSRLPWNLVQIFSIVEKSVFDPFWTYFPKIFCPHRWREIKSAGSTKTIYCCCCLFYAFQIAHCPPELCRLPVCPSVGPSIAQFFLWPTFMLPKKLELMLPLPWSPPYCAALLSVCSGIISGHTGYRGHTDSTHCTFPDYTRHMHTCINQTTLFPDLEMEHFFDL